MEITIHSAWVITVPILPPEAIQALINGGVVQALCIVISIAIYTPFVIIANKQKDIVSQ